MRTSRIFGFKHTYSQEFLDWLAKEYGFKWTKVEFKTIPKDKVTVCPMSKPSGQLNYLEYKFNERKK